MLEDLVGELRNGLDTYEYCFSLKNRKDGRISNQEYFDLYMTGENRETKLMNLSVYHGNMPHYKPWVELFGIVPQVNMGEESFLYFGSKAEELLLNLFSSHLGDGGRIFIEYQKDKETREGLLRGFPAATSRLGFELFKRDFTWFKDWYFPEGFKEGGEKLQAEKAIDEGHRISHLESIREELKEMLETEPDDDAGRVELDCRERGEKILQGLED